MQSSFLLDRQAAQQKQNEKKEKEEGYAGN